jgi:hypothetical protein
MDEVEALIQTAAPTLMWRVWRKLGYHFHFGEGPEGAEALIGWHCTEIGMDFSFVDRLRLLITGKLRLRSILMTDTPSATICKNRLDWWIVRPGGDG